MIASRLALTDGEELRLEALLVRLRADAPEAAALELDDVARLVLSRGFDVVAGEITDREWGRTASTVEDRPPASTKRLRLVR